VPRETIGLDPEELSAFLGAARWAVLVTGGGADPHPGGELVELALDGDRLLVWPSAGAQAAIDAEARVCVIVEEQPDYAGIKGALVHGIAVRLDDDRVAVPLDEVVSFDFARLRVNQLRSAPGS
jgi:hypothetical protein